MAFPSRHSGWSPAARKAALEARKSKIRASMGMSAITHQPPKEPVYKHERSVQAHMYKMGRAIERAHKPKLDVPSDYSGPTSKLKYR